MKLNITVLFLALMGGVVQESCAADASAAIPFGPFAGDTGYQDIKLADKSWYVAVFGNRKTDLAWVENGWKTRAAQLCSGMHEKYFVEMRYVGERILIDEKAVRREGSDVSQFMRTVGAVYIPIIIPSGPREVADYVIPGKQAPIFCLQNLDLLSDKTRAVSVQEVLHQAPNDKVISQ